jgi:hypothetical protein
MVGPGVVSLSRENRDLVQGGGVKGPLKHKGNFQAFPHPTSNEPITLARRGPRAAMLQGLHFADVNLGAEPITVIAQFVRTAM